MRQFTQHQRQVYDKIKPAIESKNLIKFYYEDNTTDFKDWRVVEPYMIYQHKSTDNIILLGNFNPTPEQVLRGHKKDLKNYNIEDIDIRKLFILEEKYTKTNLLYKGGKNKNASFIYCYTPSVI